MGKNIGMKMLMSSYLQCVSSVSREIHDCHPWAHMLEKHIERGPTDVEPAGPTTKSQPSAEEIR